MMSLSSFSIYSIILASTPGDSQIE